nr:hypothetical protein [Mycoplasmopsis bovis]
MKMTITFKIRSLRVINAKIDFQKAINLVKELKKDIDEYKKNIAKRYNSTFLMQLSDYQLSFLSSQNVQNNSELVNAYKKLISSFNNSSTSLNKKVEEYIKLVEESKKQIAQTLSNEDYACSIFITKIWRWRCYREEIRWNPKNHH